MGSCCKAEYRIYREATTQVGLGRLGSKVEGSSVEAKGLRAFGLAFECRA